MKISIDHGKNLYQQIVFSKVMQSLAWVALAIIALPTVVGSYIAIQKAVHVWDKVQTPTTAKTNRVASSSSLGKNSLERALDQWVKEAPLGENRVRAKKRILFFIDSQSTYLDLSKLGLTSLPDIFNNPCFCKLKELFLENNQLKALPSTIGHLKGLQWLKVYKNQLLILPKEIGKLRNLKMLDLRHNQLEHLSKEIGELLLLEWLVLNDNKLTNLPEEIGGLIHLKTLNLPHNKLESLPKEMGKLLLLEWLDLEDNQLKAIPHTIADLPALERLNLRKNSLESLKLKNPNPTPAEIVKDLTGKPIKFQALKWLNLAENNLKELPSEIGDAKELEWLNLSHNKLARLPSSFGHLQKLRNLNLSYNQIAYLINNLSKLLKTLDISHNKLIELPSTLKWLQELEWLNLSHNQLKAFPLENLQADLKLKRLPMLQWLNLSHNALTELPKKIDKLANLEKIDLSHNQLKKTLSRNIGKMLMLKELNFSHNYIETLPDEIGKLVGLIELNLSYNDIENLPHTMGLLHKLIKLNVSYNNLKTLTYTLAKLENLKEFNVSNNKIIALLKGISNLQNLEVLNLGFNLDLRSLPIKKIARLSKNCEIELTGCKLFRNELLELRAIQESHKGPSINFSNIATKPIEKSLAYLYGLIHKNPMELPHLQRTQELTYWLDLVSNPELKISQRDKQAFAQKIISYLERANEDDEFIHTFYALIEEPFKNVKDQIEISTEESVSKKLEISILNLDLAYKLSTIAYKGMKELAGFLKDVWIVNMLGQLARNKVPTFPIFDKMETDLGFLNNLIKEKNLVDVQDMLYFICSALKQEDLEEAKQILNKLSDQEAYFEFLINNDKWKESLELKYPKQFASMENQKKHAADSLTDLTRENKAILKTRFDQKLKELTKKSL
ncbi:leucine-rich repeat domain-containing protein [Candidatus Rhabdochlamydia sp. T3358]|uniref:leucine-rich repeat domain-containing protein n=1 Tax=Candidatus Rhabdochlamydia sp. T3358 TaxID=2099795 RepID=UPI0010AF5B8B|nr:leucine-rich repeat domain-containing protein [Candidatus Rhabdochlamydia sp. T3358]VHO03003.1 E3 ubiquitin-protein ligase SlrP [Candidatus Rhabdochlamydia sp. T3358]